jgi:putative phosphoesterase
MKILFFSDIHGVPANLEQLFRQADGLHPDRMVLLGDALYHGPRNGVPEHYDPQAVAKLLNSRAKEIMAIRGNCDSEVDQMLLDFPILADYAEILTETGRFFVTHGHLWNEKKLPPVPADTILVHGHTHIPELKRLDGGIILFNPGSISLPKNGLPKTYGLWDGSALTIRLLADGAVFNV